MSSETKKRLLIVGQTPPPWHGQAVATKMLVDGEWATWEIDSVRMAFSDDLESVGRFKFGKIWHLFSQGREISKKLTEHPGTVLLYPPASASWLPFVRDVFILGRVRKYARGTAFIFHASGLAEFTQGSWLRKFLAKKAYGGVDLALEVAQVNLSPGKTFGAKTITLCPCAAEVPAFEAGSFSPGKPREILFVGSLMEGKGVMEILKTASIFKSRGESRFSFQIVGRWASAAFEKECLAFVESSEIGELVQFKGQLTGDTKISAFRSASLFFFPSHYSSEASPIVLMEALGFGLPVVSTRWAGIPALVGECEAVTLCEVKAPGSFADVIVERLGDSSDDLAVREIARDFFEQRFTPEQFIGRVEDGLNQAGLCNS
ncbi:glycosyltransferase [Akkermansiaceae bacterium]|nr:glycosyltransferase [Akkermansiaceae bacterium]